MQITETKSSGGGNKIGTRGFLSKEGQRWRWPFRLNLGITAVNSLFIIAFFIQMQYSEAETKQPLLIDSTFSQPSRLQLRFWPMGKYAASTYTSHIRIPFNYFSLMDLQLKMNARLDTSLTNYVTGISKFPTKQKLLSKAFSNFTSKTQMRSSNFFTTCWQVFLMSMNVNDDNGTWRLSLLQPQPSPWQLTTRCRSQSSKWRWKPNRPRRTS